MQQPRELNVLQVADRYREFTQYDTLAGTGRNGYVPLFSIIPFVKGGTRLHHQEAVNFRNMLVENKGVPRAIVEAIPSSNLQTSSNRNTSAQPIVDDLKAWLNNPIKYCMGGNWSNVSNLRGVGNYTKGLDIPNAEYVTIGAIQYLKKWGSLSTYSYNYSSGMNEYKTLYSVVVKKEHHNYIKKLWILGEPIPNNLLEIWIHPDFKYQEIKPEEHKSACRVFRMKVLPKLIEKGVKIIVRDDIDDVLYNRFSMPKFNSPKQYKEWFSDFVSNYLDTRVDDYGHDDSQRRVNKEENKLVSVLL